MTWLNQSGPHSPLCGTCAEKSLHLTQSISNGLRSSLREWLSLGLRTAQRTVRTTLLPPDQCSCLIRHRFAKSRVINHIS